MLGLLVIAVVVSGCGKEVVREQTREPAQSSAGTISEQAPRQDEVEEALPDQSNSQAISEMLDSEQIEEVQIGEPQEEAASSEDKAEPEQLQNNQSGEEEKTCILSISCAAVLDNLEELEEGKQGLIPENGWILSPTEVVFYEGESVFHVLQRTCREQKIHIEFEDTPIYNSAYIRGIGNLYEFDCGDLSGWKYQVNGWFPNYGCGSYVLEEGDVIQWVYTCDLKENIDVGEYVDG